MTKPLCYFQEVKNPRYKTRLINNKASIINEYSISKENFYDSHENWIKKTSYSNQRINGILERTITY